MDITKFISTQISNDVILNKRNIKLGSNRYNKDKASILRFWKDSIINFKLLIQQSLLLVHSSLITQLRPYLSIVNKKTMIISISNLFLLLEVNQISSDSNKCFKTSAGQSTSIIGYVQLIDPSLYSLCIVFLPNLKSRTIYDRRRMVERSTIAVEWWRKSSSKIFMFN